VALEQIETLASSSSPNRPVEPDWQQSAGKRFCVLRGH